ncbi:MAG: hypothetical protein A3A44_01665 [Candidatus Sungbacteria bacterium RIFCSPLOWO2_01_FULL_60_25]|uniref:Nudix hydrolase domain-containing protein n=1 Tax=Candidatus Sungbacteria bacterium RIFCSPLOWO2_01_FULL_60_25 TaxID=1802281 RepID=A0A1G2LFG1_9BACT|nr:MAG: hypothetical protein A3A44_01665 [Candidatus Sungbacteria bacterium RIFCSPLOWO2_01_FULL_60_25]
MPHIHKDIDFTVGAAIVHQGKILLVDHPRYGMRLMPGGHVELTEDIDQALLREIREETGLGPDDTEVVAERIDPDDAGDAKPLWVPRWMNIHPANLPHRHMALMYLVRAKTDRVKLDGDEHQEIRWFAPRDLGDSSLAIPPDVRWYAREAIRILS